uniref:N/A n=1 Tax=Ganoderma boninense TaxID=34458 RepID=A0A5K1JTE8_9APHY|nr:N/A [Ganoderma boninense]
MANGANAQTAVEVTRGGGFGFVGAGFSTPEALRQDFDFIRSSFPDRVNKPLPVGYGFIGWLLDKNEEGAKQLLDITIENNVQAIWLAFGTDIHRWIQHVRTSSANARAHHKPLIFVQVTSVEEALVAANEWKVDAIVAQAGRRVSKFSLSVLTRVLLIGPSLHPLGTESGGHGGASATSTFTLVSEILAALPQDGAAPVPPILAAGGMATGAQVAAYLSLGAAGAALGTRFLLTPESAYKPAQRAALLAARGPGATVRTMALDTARASFGWPAGIDGRGLNNKIVDDIDAGVDHATVQARCKAATEAGDSSYMVVWAGQGVSLMNEIKPVKVDVRAASATLAPLTEQDVMAELHTDLVRQLQKSQRLLQDDS